MPHPPQPVEPPAAEPVEPVQILELNQIELQVIIEAMRAIPWNKVNVVTVGMITFNLSNLELEDIKKKLVLMSERLRETPVAAPTPTDTYDYIGG